MIARTPGAFSALQVATTTDQVFEALNRAMITLQLPPGSKVSEADVAKQFGVSRQPVRDAFFRLSQQGLLLIRPQRATLVTFISEHSVLRAAFVRSALESACMAAAAVKCTDAELAELDKHLEDQAAALADPDHGRFHELDNHMHRRICEMSGHGYTWPLIQDQKAHIDRVRFLALTVERQTAFEQHRDIVTALKHKDPEKAVAHLQNHLGRIHSLMTLVRNTHPQLFEDSPA